jgi:hypothetical protein
MRSSGQRKRLKSEPPPRKRHTPPSEQTDEAPGLLEREEVEVERELPAEDNQPIERIEPRERPDPPLFELREPTFILLLVAAGLYLLLGSLGEGLFVCAGAVVSLGMVSCRKREASARYRPYRPSPRAATSVASFGTTLMSMTELYYGDRGSNLIQVSLWPCAGQFRGAGVAPDPQAGVACLSAKSMRVR